MVTSAVVTAWAWALIGAATDDLIEWQVYVGWCGRCPEHSLHSLSSSSSFLSKLFSSSTPEHIRTLWRLLSSSLSIILSGLGTVT